MRGTKALRFFVVTVLTAVAISNAVAAAAQAEPERGTCKATSEGLYKDSLCLEEGGTAEGHEFEWIPAKSASFTATSGDATLKSFTPEGAELPAVECKKSKSKGKAGATTTTSVVTLEDCSSAGEGCTGGANATPGQIVTFELNGKLGYIEGESIVGEDLVGTGPNGLVAEFTCGANTIQTAGSVIGVVAPLDMSTKSFTLTFTSTGEHQAIEAFEGASKDTLQTEINGLGAGTLPFPSAFDVTDVIKDVAKELLKRALEPPVIIHARNPTTGAKKCTFVKMKDKCTIEVENDGSAIIKITREEPKTGDERKFKVTKKCLKKKLGPAGVVEPKTCDAEVELDATPPEGTTFKSQYQVEAENDLRGGPPGHDEVTLEAP